MITRGSHLLIFKIFRTPLQKQLLIDSYRLMIWDLGGDGDVMM